MKPERQPKYAAIADQLAADIRAGRMRSGDRLPGHVRLARLHGVSVITSNRALAELERRGLAERRSRHGTFVLERRAVLRSILVPTSARFQQVCPQVMDYLEGLLSEAHERGIGVRIEPCESRFLQTAESIRDLECQAVIQLGVPPPDLFPYRPLRLSRLPWIGVGLQEGCAAGYVNEDRALGARLLVQALREDGFRRIGFIADLSRQNHRFARDGYLEGTKDDGVEASLIRDADATTVVENVKALQKKTDALIVVGVMGIAALSYLRGVGSQLAAGLFMENADMLPFKGQAYFVEQDHAEVGREGVRLAVNLVEGELSEPGCRFVKPRITRPAGIPGI